MSTLKKRKKNSLIPARPKIFSGDVCTPRNFWIMVLFSFIFVIQVILTGFVISLYQSQLLMVRAFDVLSNRSQYLVSAPKDEAGKFFKETQVPGLYYEYQPCKPTFTGACDDALLYRLAKNGSKEVAVPSLRRLTGAPLTNELLQPISQSPDKRWMVFGAWSFGSNRNVNDRRIWLFDQQVGDVVLVFSAPVDAVYSPDFKYAAYASPDGNGDIRDVTILDIWTGRDVGGAKAEIDVTFMGPDGRALLRWEDDKNLFISEYVKTDKENPVPVLRGEKNLKVK